MAQVQGTQVGGSGSSGFTLSSATYGLDTNMLDDYLKEINVNTIDKAIEELEKTEGLKQVFQEGWQGAAESNFERNLDSGVSNIITTLREVEKAISTLIYELADDIIEQDAQMVELDDSIGRF